MADQIEAMAAAIERAAPGFDGGATALVEAVTQSRDVDTGSDQVLDNVDAVRREVLAAADLICWELRSAAVRTRAGNANLASLAPSESEQPPSPEIERQLIYTLHPLLWREGDEVRTGSGLCAGRAAQGAAAGSAAASACGPSQRPPRADPDASSWQRRAPVANPRLTIRSSSISMRCSRRRRRARKPTLREPDERRSVIEPPKRTPRRISSATASSRAHQPQRKPEAGAGVRPVCIN